MRLLLAAVAATLCLAGVARATSSATPVIAHQAGASSQNGRVDLRVRGIAGSTANPLRVSQFTIRWTARCPKQAIYRGSSALRGMRIAGGGRFAGHLDYSHSLAGGARVRVAVTVNGRLHGVRTRASGTWRGVARVPGVGRCSSRVVSWTTTG